MGYCPTIAPVGLQDGMQGKGKGDWGSDLKGVDSYHVSEPCAASERRKTVKAKAM